MISSQARLAVSCILIVAVSIVVRLPTHNILFVMQAISTSPFRKQVRMASMAPVIFETETSFKYFESHFILYVWSTSPWSRMNSWIDKKIHEWGFQWTLRALGTYRHIIVVYRGGTEIMDRLSELVSCVTEKLRPVHYTARMGILGDATVSNDDRQTERKSCMDILWNKCVSLFRWRWKVSTGQTRR